MEYYTLNHCKRYLRIYGHQVYKKEYTTYLDSDHYHSDINDYILYSDNMDYIIVKQRKYRLSSPALQETRPEGTATLLFSNIIYKFNYYNRKLHGKCTEYDIVTQKICTETWYVNGLLHRDNGPAIIDVRPGITFYEYYKNGKFIYLESECK